MNLRTCTAILLVTLAWAPAQPVGAREKGATTAPARIAVLPLVPLDGAIKAGAGETLRDLLAAELNRQSPDRGMADGTRFGAYRAEAVTMPIDAGAEEALAAARGELDAARRHVAEGSLDAAIAAFEASIARMEAALPALQGSLPLAGAYSALALALFQRGRDADAETALNRAILLSPDAPLAEEASSPRLAWKVGQRRAELARLATARVDVDSVPRGALVEVDGRPIGRAPLRVEGLSPGRHLVRAILPTSGRPLARMIEVGPEARIEFRPAGGGGLGLLLDLLAENRLDERAIDAALEVASAQGAAHVIGGVLSTEDMAAGAPGMVRLDAFVIDARSRTLLRIAPTRFDADLLSAGIELSRMVRALVESEVGTGEAVEPPFAVRPAWRPRVARSEVRFGSIELAPPEGAAASTGATPAGRPTTRRPIDPRRASGALKPREGPIRAGALPHEE